MKKNFLFAILTTLLLAGCLEPQPAAPAALPYYFVTAPAEATPTPFQPPAQQAASAQSTATLPPILPTITQQSTPTAPTTALPTAAIAGQPQPVIVAEDVVTFLLLGSDLRPGSSYRTDTIIVAIVRPGDGQVSLISIPRDLWVNIPTVGMQRINTAYQSGEITAYSGGGPGLLKDTLLFNLGIKIDHTAMVDFDGFRRIVDTLGGIDVPVACPYTDWRLIAPNLDPEDENSWQLYTAGPGYIHMDGDLALWYARSRKKSNDFDRGRRQQEVIRSIYGQALRTDSLSHIPQLYNDFNATIKTDLGLDSILKLTPLSLHLTNADIRSYYIAGDLVTPWITPGGAYVLLPNYEAIQGMLTEAVNPSPRQVERQALKIEIQNGSPNDGWDALAGERLNYAGYETLFAPADNRQHTQTLLYDLTPEQDRNRTASLLAVLGLPQSALVSAPDANAKVSYALIVGTDYQPCFQPAELTP
jgi:LCP family protein required for cell wall assembly